MGRDERRQLLREFQDLREGRLAIAYFTSTRPGLELQMADDVLRFLYEHLVAGADAAKRGVDVIIHSNGGHGTVPWRITSLIREFTEDFTVVVPHRAFSAATLLALGANNILMHRMGCLGPIDPSVANAFNPPHPLNPAQIVPISVEDVTAYFKHVKEDVGITHEDELVQALLALTKVIHPLALGNVQRSHNQSRLMAAKLLRTHIAAEKEHEIEQTIDNLKSNLFFHGHPINRHEAKNDLKLAVTYAEGALEEKLWQLYLEYENDMQLNERLDVATEYEQAAKSQPELPRPPTTQELVQQIVQLAQNGIGVGTIPTKDLVEMAAAMLPHLGARQAQSHVRLEGLRGVYLESNAHTDCFRLDIKIERVVANTPSGPQPGTRTELLNHRWETEK